MIIAAPSGLGKTTLSKKYPDKIIDLDSSYYTPFSKNLNYCIRDIIKLDSLGKIVLISNSFKIFYKLIKRHKKPFLIFYYSKDIKEKVLEKLIIRDGRKSLGYGVVYNQTEVRFEIYSKYDNTICIDTMDYDLEEILKQGGVLC